MLSSAPCCLDRSTRKGSQGLCHSDEGLSLHHIAANSRFMVLIARGKDTVGAGGRNILNQDEVLRLLVHVASEALQKLEVPSNALSSLNQSIN